MNCAALPTAWESELFGYEKGAFTGANSFNGKFELAQNGTILLDEIGEMLHYFRQNFCASSGHEVDRIGGRKPVPIQLRVIATTNRICVV